MWGVVFVLVGALVVSVASPLAAQEKKEEAKAEKKDEKKKEGLPLQPERKVKFTTDEGTWLSLDVAPDGKTIVFELLGDLYTLPIEGGPAKRLTSGLPFHSQPRYSPDGQWLGLGPAPLRALDCPRQGRPRGPDHQGQDARRPAEPRAPQRPGRGRLPRR